MNIGLTLFALGFTDVALLGWLAAAGVPLLIHLWQRRQRREIPWGAMQFLQLAWRKQARRLHLEQWLLLVLRMLILAGIVLAAAGPFWRRAARIDDPNEPTLRIVALDVSYSMGTVNGERTRWEAAKAQALRWIDEAPAGDGFCLVLLSQPARVVVGQPTRDRAQFRREVDGVELTESAADLPDALRRVAELLRQPSAHGPNFTRQRVLIASDLGTNTWRALDSATGSQATEQLRLAAPETCEVLITDVGAQAENVSVEALVLQEGLPVAARDLTFAAEIKNHTNQPRRVSAEFLDQGRRVRQWQHELSAGERKRVAWSERLETAGEHALEYRIGGDALALDNHRYLSLSIKPRIRVLVVNGDADPEAANYLLFALNPEKPNAALNSAESTGAAATTDVVTETAGEANWLNAGLGAYDSIWFNNTARFTAHEAQALRDFQARGGSIVWWLGPRSQAAVYNQELASGPQPLLPATLLAPVAPQARAFTLDPLDYRHPVVRVFAGHERAGLLQTPLHRYFRLTPRGDAAVAVAIQPTGDPGIVLGAGAGEGTAVAAWPASLAAVDVQSGEPWSLMPALPSFQPVVQELLAALVTQTIPRFQTTVGAPLVGPWSWQTPSEARIELPDLTSNSGRLPAALGGSGSGGETRPVALALQNDPQRPGWSRWTFAETANSGFIRVTPLEIASPTLFAVNLETSESDLTHWSPAEWPVGWQVVSDVDNTPSSTSGTSVTSGLQSALLIGVLVLAVVESLVAWRLGRQTA